MAADSLGLFQGFGVEMEYMLVRDDSLAVLPIADQLLAAEAGELVSDVERGAAAWSNELVLHVVEIKCNGPAPELAPLPALFQGEVNRINELLRPMNARLLPTGAHPLMDPMTETKLWPHENREIYQLYHDIFDCRGHGWSNLQSTHLNLPFAGDDEFARLHAAIRLLLPILPALSASTPILDGKLAGYADARLEVYRINQRRIPSLTGMVVPEQAFSKQEYYDRILNVIQRDVKPFDKRGVLDRHFLNSRGAIARFDRNAIEIRIIDIQECPKADLAIVALAVATLRSLVGETWSGLATQQAWHERDLSPIFLDVVRDAEAAVLRNRDYLAMFGLDKAECSAGDLWRHILGKVALAPDFAETAGRILDLGSLSTRIVRAIGPNPGRDRIEAVYRRLADCLASGELFQP